MLASSLPAFARSAARSSPARSTPARSTLSRSTLVRSQHSCLAARSMRASSDWQLARSLCSSSASLALCNRLDASSLCGSLATLALGRQPRQRSSAATPALLAAAALPLVTPPATSQPQPTPRRPPRSAAGQRRGAFPTALDATCARAVLALCRCSAAHARHRTHAYSCMLSVSASMALYT